MSRKPYMKKCAPSKRRQKRAAALRSSRTHAEVIASMWTTRKWTGAVSSAFVNWVRVYAGFGPLPHGKTKARGTAKKPHDDGSYRGVPLYLETTSSAGRPTYEVL